MNSINRYISPRALAAQIRMERQTHKGAFLLVEGRTDKLRFGKFVDDVECVIIDCKGKPNVIGTIEILYDNGFRGALGMVDADFDRLTSYPKEHGAIIVSEAHDFDMEMFLSSAFDRYLVEVGDAEKVRVFGSNDNVKAEIYRLSKPIAILRFVNIKLGLACAAERDGKPT